MFELEQKCWNEYLQKTKYRRNKIIDFITIVGLIATAIGAVQCSSAKEQVIKNLDNKLTAIMLFVIFSALYIFFEFVGKLCDKSEKKLELDNMKELELILKKHHCSLEKFSTYFYLIQEKTKNKIKKYENNMTTIFTFFLTMLFTLVSEENKTYNLIEIFWIFIAYYCFKHALKIIKRCMLHYDIELIFEKTNEQLIYLKQYQKTDFKSIFKNIISRLIS